MSIDLNSSGEMEMMLNNETNLHGKSWREALREAASISGVVVLDSRKEKYLKDETEEICGRV
ncbi:hypothetical protein glysoja_042962 [Glycine soja]|uniref:Uncharacterized protein n=1 Tax=Glycine soja TaxID=3848 RepID=A0A0B2S6J5_GLYSO|nr:hypothetical protein glysoja_042962 [Glycine soja]